MDLQKGLLCSLTNKFADFEDTCDHFKKDIREEAYILNRKMAAVGEDVGDPIDFRRNKKIGTIIFCIGIGITIGAHLMAEVTGVLVITYGAIVYGASQYFKGVKQEKLLEEYKQANRNEKPNDNVGF